MLRVTLLVTAVAALTAGCGAARVEPPDPSRPFATLPPADRAFPAAGLTFRAPADLAFGEGEAPLVTSTSTGTATIAIWRYPRSEPLPRTADELRAVAPALEQAARTRDPSLRLQRTRRVRIDGAPGIELLGVQHIAGRERRVRSTHLYAHGAEVVVDAFAAQRDFKTVDEAIFRPLLDSLTLDEPEP